MNPVDLILFAMSFVLAVLVVALHGLTPNGLGPAVLMLAGSLWKLYMEWLRHRSWQKHRDTAFVPGTQHLAMLGILGMAIAWGAAFVWMFITLPRL